MTTDAIVLDASAYIQSLTQPLGAGAVIRTRLEHSTRWIVPGFFDLECLAVCQRFPQGRQREEVTDRVVVALAVSLLERVDVHPFLPRIRQLIPNVTSFDAAYVVTAEAYRAPLLTCDQRLSRAFGPRCEFEVF